MRFIRDNLVILGLCILGILIIVFNGVTMNIPVLFKIWNINTVNYILNLLVDFSMGVIVSAIFYFLVVYFPKMADEKSLGLRLTYLFEGIQADITRITQYFNEKIGYEKKSENDLSQEDFVFMGVKLMELWDQDPQKAIYAVDYLVRHSSKLENDLHQLIYYKEYFNIDAKLLLDKVLRSLYFDIVQRFYLDNYKKPSGDLRVLSNDWYLVYTNVNNLKLIVLNSTRDKKSR